MEINLSSTISWTPVSQAADYEVLLVLNGAGPNTGVAVGLATTTSASLAASALIGAAQDGVAYELYVRARSSSGAAGAWSDVVNVTVKLSPGQVTGVTIT